MTSRTEWVATKAVRRLERVRNRVANEANPPALRFRSLAEAEAIVKCLLDLGYALTPSPAGISWIPPEERKIIHAAR